MENEPNKDEPISTYTEGTEQTFYHEEDESNADAPQAPQGKEVAWTASEFIAHHKTAGWYIALGLITAIVSVLMYLLVEDRLTVATIVVVALSFGFFASRPPRTLEYKITSHGITIGEKLYPYSILRTFSIQKEGAVKSILLIPLKRFMPAISMYYPPEQENEIINTLSSYLPHEERKPDLIDRLMHHVRF